MGTGPPQPLKLFFRQILRAHATQLFQTADLYFDVLDTRLKIDMELWGAKMKRTRNVALMLCVMLLGVVLPGLVVAQQSVPRFAVIFMSPDLQSHMQTLNTPRLIYEAQRLQYNGYTVITRPGTTEEVMNALLNPQVRAIVFAGHGGVQDASGRSSPTLAGYAASGWQANYRLALMNRYVQQGMSVDMASAKASRDAQNFGLDQVVNYSCWSLADPSIANLFVRPGGHYWGTRSLYSAYPCDYHLILSNADYFMEHYSPGVPFVDTPPPKPQPKPPTTYQAPREIRPTPPPVQLPSPVYEAAPRPGSR